jgi:hypothetical protein
VLSPRAATASTPAATTPAVNAGAAGMTGGEVPPAPIAALPPLLRLLRRFPVLQGIPARLIAIGPLPEHAPEWARRAPEPAAR